jgi:tellurite resistance protein
MSSDPSLINENLLNAMDIIRNVLDIGKIVGHDANTFVHFIGTGSMYTPFIAYGLQRLINELIFRSEIRNLTDKFNREQRLQSAEKSKILRSIENFEKFTNSDQISKSEKLKYLKKLKLEKLKLLQLDIDGESQVKELTKIKRFIKFHEVNLNEFLKSIENVKKKKLSKHEKDIEIGKIEEMYKLYGESQQSHKHREVARISKQQDFLITKVALINDRLKALDSVPNSTSDERLKVKEALLKYKYILDATIQITSIFMNAKLENDHSVLSDSESISHLLFLRTITPEDFCDYLESLGAYYDGSTLVTVNIPGSELNLEFFGEHYTFIKSFYIVYGSGYSEVARERINHVCEIIYSQMTEHFRFLTGD